MNETRKIEKDKQKTQKRKKKENIYWLGFNQRHRISHPMTATAILLGSFDTWLVDRKSIGTETYFPSSETGRHWLFLLVVLVYVHDTSDT